MRNSHHQPHGGALTVRIEHQGDVQLIMLDGEMDGSNAHDLEDELIRLEDAGCPEIVLDLSQLEFIDSTGLAVILRAHQRRMDNGHSLSVVRPQQGPVGRAFELCGMDMTLSFVD